MNLSQQDQLQNIFNTALSHHHQSQLDQALTSESSNYNAQSTPKRAPSPKPRKCRLQELPISPIKTPHQSSQIDYLAEELQYQKTANGTMVQNLTTHSIKMETTDPCTRNLPETPQDLISNWADDTFTSSEHSQALASPKGAQALASPKGAQALASPKGAQALASPKGAQALASPKGAQASVLHTLFQAASALQTVYKELPLPNQAHSKLEHHLVNITTNPSNPSLIDETMSHYKLTSQAPAPKKEQPSTKPYAEAFKSHEKAAPPVPIRPLMKETQSQRRTDFFDRTPRFYNPPRPTGPKPRTSSSTPRWSSTNSEYNSSTPRQPIKPALHPTVPQPKAHNFETMQEHQKKFEVRDKYQKPTPEGAVNSLIYPWTVTKRQKDRDLPHRLAPVVSMDDLNKAFSVPAPREPYRTLYWTTTDFMEPVPTWAKIPHCAHSLSLAIEHSDITPETHPERFHLGLDLYIFPMDDNIFRREISFETFRYDQEWFFRIKEEIEFPDSSVELSHINIPWDRVEQFAEQLQAVFKTPLPPAKDMSYANPGTYDSKTVYDAKRKTFYYIDTLQESNQKGWFRMIHISQETQNPDSRIVGNVSFPWHKMDFFIQKFNDFRTTTD
jgi:hypothetical protein